MDHSSACDLFLDFKENTPHSNPQTETYLGWGERVSKKAAIFAIVIGVLALIQLAEAQQASKVYKVGLLSVASPTGYARQIEAFRKGLRDLGYVEGKSITIEFRWADGNVARLPELAYELVRLNPDVLVTSGPGTAIAKRATSTIPIVMAAATNAVETGLVASLARPGGNVTGSSSFGRELAAKRLELLKEAFPRLSRVGVLLPSDSPSNPGLVQALQDAARSVKAQLQVVEAASSADFERAIATLVKGRADALIVADHTMLVAEAERISRLANANHLPVIGFVEIADTGGLMGYGVDFPVLWHRAASFVDRILKGTKPGDLPVEQPMNFEIVINLKTAKALGLTISPSLLLRADRVIE